MLRITAAVACGLVRTKMAFRLPSRRARTLHVALVAVCTVASSSVVGGWAGGSTAVARPLDIHLEKLADARVNPTEKLECQTCQSLLSEVGLAMGSRMVGPAASLGPLGVEAAYEVSFAQVNSKASYWQRAVEKPQASLTTGQVRVRKGLPYSMQFGTVLSYLSDSNLWGIGAEMNLSLVDGFRKIPDLSVRLNGMTVLGNSDMSMVVFGGDGVLSKSFGIAGLLSLQPWAGYSFATTYVKSNQIPVFPDAFATRPELLLMKQFFDYSHRAAFGLRMIVTRVQLGAEFLRSFTEDLNVTTLKVGVVF